MSTSSIQNDFKNGGSTELFNHQTNTYSACTIARECSDILDTIDGKITDSECMVLYDLAQKAFNGCIVEIGSYKGKSTVALGLGTMSGNNVDIFAVDPHQQFIGLSGSYYSPADRTEFLRNILRAGCTEMINLINLPSSTVASVWNRKVSLLWIDGDHRMQSVLSDLYSWYPHVRKGGIVLMHDIDSIISEPLQAMQTAMSDGLYEFIKQIGRIAILRKP